ncbi:hypothetical protein B0J13DRAFT_599833 [Dactylonectria estremocensis]|uniref:C2H2-type domain-containing protein n=1 Tax=Dactylonectria estremocensis TaxID=1079267 RepID=A0A9P9DF55_9HYPO|nr:hypothetical protein B0J13DRAFT_599833 [Dactylonectria estremocensis]
MATFDEFLELLFQVCLTVCAETFIDGRPDSTLLVYLSGILGFSGDCRQFLLAKQYCSQLSGLIYMQRVLLLERALPLQPYTVIGITRCPQAQQLERFSEVRQKYMVLGSQSPLGELLSLRNFGLGIARTEPPSILFHWSDDGEILSCGDLSLSMENFRQLPAYFITCAEKICDSLMFGLEPKVDLTMHEKNDLDRAYLELLVRAYTSERDGLSRHGRWNRNSVTLYLKMVTQLEEMLAGGLYTACGQSPRASELLSLRCENGSSTTCGISIWNGFVIYVLRHHKSKRRTNREFCVARFLPSRLGRVMYKYLVYIRRLAALLKREQSGQSWPHDRERLLFHSNGNPWPSSRLTSILMQATSEVWQQKVNLQLCNKLYRQIAIAITERHVLEVHLPFNRYDDESVDADLNVAFAWQSGHRPLQCGITYGLDGAFPNRLQPALLRAYEWASTRWHEFIRQPSKEIPSLSNTPFSKPAVGPRTGNLKRTVAYAIESEQMPHSRAPSAKRIKVPGMIDVLMEQRQKSMPAQERPAQESMATSRSTYSSRAHTEWPHQETPYFTYVPELQLLGCRVCATMVTRQRIKEHLRGSPHHLSGAEIKKVQNWASELAIISGNKEIYKLPLLPDDTPPISVLGKPNTGGFRCTFSTENNIAPACRFVGSNLKRMREHLKREHGWDPQLKPGRRAVAAFELGPSSGPWRSGVYYQRLFLNGPRSEYFEVARGLDLESLATKEHNIE